MSYTQQVWAYTGECYTRMRSFSASRFHVTIGISSSAMHALHTVWRQRELSLGTMLRLYQSCILSILLYGSESWTLLKEDLCRLESFHFKCQRQILGIKWFDFVNNVDFIAATNFPSLEDTIRCRRNSLFGHVVRLSDRTPAHRALKLAAEVRTGSRPNTTWRSSVSVLDPADR